MQSASARAARASRPSISLRRIAVMIGEHLAADELGTGRAQSREQLVRATHSRERQHPAAGDRRRIGSRAELGLEPRQAGREQAVDAVAIGADPDHRRRPGEAVRNPLAERARRQQSTVAEAIAAVDHDQRQIRA